MWPRISTLWSLAKVSDEIHHKPKRRKKDHPVMNLVNLKSDHKNRKTA